MKFDDETTDVLIGGYMSKDAAKQDYEAVLACGGYLHGAVVVSKDLQGNLSVEQTDHMVREGAEGLGAVGFAVGLFAPPLLAATAVGAVIGAGAGKLLHRRTASKLEKQAGETIPIGGAGLIVAYPHSAAAKVEPAVTRAIKKVVGEAEGHHVQALKGAIADAQQKMAESGGWLDEGATSPYGEPGQHYLCPGYQAFFRHVAKPMDTMAGLLRAGRAPAELMGRYAAQDSRRGRNDPCPCGNGRKWKHCHGTRPAHWR